MTSLPRWAERLLTLVCPSDLYEQIEGDLIELYNHEIKTVGKTRANLNLVVKTIRFVRPSIIFRKKNRNNQTTSFAMLANYLLIASRTFLRNKTAFIINLVGMSIALGCCITAWVNYEYNSEFDQNQENASNIYRIAFTQQLEDRAVQYGVCPLPAGGLLRENLREGEHLIQYISKRSQFRIGDEMFEREFIYADPAFTEVFTMELLSGKLSIADKSHIVISDKLANTFFGRLDVVGEPITQIVNGAPREFEVTGVYKQFPGNSSFRFDLISNYNNYFMTPADQIAAESDWSRWATTFLYLEDPNTQDILLKQLKTFIPEQNQARQDLKVSEFYIEPFIGMGYRAVRARNQGHWLNMGMPPAAVIAPFAMAGFLLLVACFNFMNNAIAIAGRRLKEIGVRKVIGGRRKELIIQFLAETTFFCAIALGLALGLAEYFVDGWNGMWSNLDISIRYKNNLGFFGAMTALMVLTALLAGGYPAFYISRFKPIQILRGTVKFGGASLLTKSLLVFQFSVSLAAVIFAIAFYSNSKYQKSYDLGYAWRSVVEVRLDDPTQYDRLKNEISKLPLVRSVGGTENHIYVSNYNASAKADNQKTEEVDVLNVGDGYFETVNVRVLNGRGFHQQQESGEDENIVVNEEFVRRFNLKNDGIGERITLNDTVRVYVAGVVKDVYLQALFQPLSPVVFRYAKPGSYRYLVVSTEPDKLHEVNEKIQSIWKDLFPMQLYRGRLMETNMNMALEHFDAVVIIYSFLGLVAIVMSVSGLYSLVSLHLQKRTKELGIRKILGASLPHIVFQSSRLFLVVILISFVLGSVLGSVMVNALMDSVWEYYVAINTGVISLATGILTIIAIATIAYKVRSVVTANPVDSVRSE